MPAKIKTWVIWLIVAFLVYAVVKNPDRAATVVRSIWDLIYATVEGVLRFFGSLAG
ncbi:MAG: hypothetical protein FWD18_01275 [Micrococcales bacterium]|nr:hypothetical protein [Micrococcales bacterium]